MGTKPININQVHIKGNHKSMSIEEMKKIVTQLKCAYKVTYWKNMGIAFLCRIPFPDENNLLHVLITCNHVLNIYSRRINDLNTIEFSVDNKEYNLSLDNSRLFYTNEKQYDITIIEIKKSDGLNEENFLNIDKTIFTQQKKRLL